MSYTRPSLPSFADYNPNTPVNAAWLNWIDQKARQVVFTTDFGADPYGVNDSYNAIQAAINEIGSSGGIVVNPPAYTFAGYKVSQPLVFPSSNYDLVFTGMGYGSILTATGNFDLFSWTNPGVNTVTVPRTTIRDLHLVGAGTAGATSLINTSGVSGINISNILMQGIQASGYGVYVNGNGTAYSHEVNVDGLWVLASPSGGSAGLYLGPTSSDGYINRVLIQGNSSLQDGIVVSDNAGTWNFTSIHPYGCTRNSLRLGNPGATAGTWQFSDAYIDASLQECAYFAGTKNATFTNSRFIYAPAGKACLRLVNATDNFFSNTILDAGTIPSGFGILEEGTSDRNVFQNTQLLNSFTTSLTLVGQNSVFTKTGATAVIAGVAGTLGAGTTQYVGYGAGSANEPLVQVPTAFAGYARKLAVQCSVAPGAGQSFTITVRKNGADTGLVATITGAASFSAIALGLISFAEGDSICCKVVSSGGAAVSNIRLALTYMM